MWYSTLVNASVIDDRAHPWKLCVFPWLHLIIFFRLDGFVIPSFFYHVCVCNRRTFNMPSLIPGLLPECNRKKATMHVGNGVQILTQQNCWGSHSLKHRCRYFLCTKLTYEPNGTEQDAFWLDKWKLSIKTSEMIYIQLLINLLTPKLLRGR
jgi:hypothetical protein